MPDPVSTQGNIASHDQECTPTINERANRTDYSGARNHPGAQTTLEYSLLSIDL